MKVSEAFSEVMALAEAMGVQRVNELPGCWEVQVSEGWRIAVNGHREPTKCSNGADVPPFHVAVDWHGFPAGIFGVQGGLIAAGDAANEASLIAALKAKAREVRGGPPPEASPVDDRQIALPLGGEPT